MSIQTTSAIRADGRSAGLGLPTATESAAWRSLQRSLQRLESIARGFDLLSFEEQDESEVRVELGLGIGPLHVETREAARRLVELAGDGDEEAAALAFGVRSQLSESHALFQAASVRGRTLDVLEAAGRGVGEVVRAARAIDELAARRAGTEPLLTRDRDARAAAALRRELSALYEQLGEAAEEVGLAGLRRTVARLAELPARHRGAMRLADCVSLRRLQEKLEQLEEGGVAAADDLRRLDNELRAVVALLLGINHREDLVVHDREVVRRLLGILPSDGPLPAAFRGAAAALAGRSTALDAMLANDEASSSAVARELESILASL